MRYEDASQEVVDILNDMIVAHFPDLKNVGFKCIFDNKKKVKNGKINFAYIKKVNEFTMFLAEEDFDYVLVVDKNIFNAIEKPDKIRIIRHELRHCFVDGESVNDPYKLIDHDIEDFYDEVILNQDDPKWALREATIAESVYDKENNEEK